MKNIKHPFKAYAGNDPYIFVCYSHKDSEYVYGIINELNEKGYRIWYDEGCEAGYDWGDTVEERIKHCRSFLVFISENMLASRISRNELEIAADDMNDSNIKIVPVNIDDSALNGKLNVQLHGIQQVKKSLYGDKIMEELTDVLPSETCAVKMSDEIKKTALEKTVDADDIAAISEGFLFRELKKYIELDDTKFTKIQLGYSRIFCHFWDNCDCDGSNLFVDLTDKFFGKNGKKPYAGKYFIKLSGTSGTGKSTFMQLLYLSFLRKCGTDYMPVYYNLSFYENMTTGDPSQFIITDFKAFAEYFNDNNITPIFFIDGICKCQFTEKPLDNIVNDCLREVGRYQKIVSIEENFTCNPERSRRDADITNNASIEIWFSSIDLIETDECTELMKSAEELGRLESGEDLLHYFKRYQFYETDLFLVDKFAARQKETDLTSRTIYDWFEDILKHDYRCDDDFLSDAARIAHRYSYTNDRISEIIEDEGENAAKAFSIMRSHRFFNDYLIARNYVENILEYEDSESLEFFEMVLPKQITRFIVARANKDILTEQEMLEFITDNYAKFSTLGKSEATFFLGRFKSTNIKRIGTAFLMNEYQTHKKQIAEKVAAYSYDHKGEYLDELFLLRGISVSLVGCGEREVLKEYIESLIANPYANEINRGFHLEYYGDKIYMPGTKSLDYMDAIDKGEKTIQYLCKSLDDFIIECKETKTGEVVLFTLCSLIQARIEKTGEYKAFDIKKYIKRAISYIEQYRRPSEIKRVPQNFESEKFDQYLKSIKKDFIDYNADKNQPIEANVFNIYSDASRIKRKGWVKSGIENPENIVEHSFNLMLMTLFYVPSKDEWNIYDKNKIMKMLFIHDLTETVLGDIPKPDKQADLEGKYDRNEDMMMKQLLLKGTYPSIANLDEYYSLWEEFCAQKTDDAKLAKDIDIIQAVYQFKKYYKKYPNNFSQERVQKWLDEYYALKTDFGRELFERLVSKNIF